jgi:hypothetical protein
MQWIVEMEVAETWAACVLNQSFIAAGPDCEAHALDGFR